MYGTTLRIHENHLKPVESFEVLKQYMCHILVLDEVYNIEPRQSDAVGEFKRGNCSKIVGVMNFYNPGEDDSFVLRGVKFKLDIEARHVLDGKIYRREIDVIEQEICGHNFDLCKPKVLIAPGRPSDVEAKIKEFAGGKAPWEV